MKNGSNKTRVREIAIPTLEQVERERARLREKEIYTRSVLTTVLALIVVAALSVLLTTVGLPVLQVSGNSMEPSLSDGEIVLLLRTKNFKTGDLIGFYYQNKILLKRAIGSAGDVVDIAEDGTVSVNSHEIEEPYLNEKSMGQCDIALPYQVPDGQIFVMGDHRETSLDSRSSEIGCVRNDRIVGKVILCIWPMDKIGLVS